MQSSNQNRYISTTGQNRSDKIFTSMIHDYFLYFLVRSPSSEKPHHSFIASVNLESFILWNGNIRVLWDQAKARAELKESDKYSEIEANGYKIELKMMEGNKEL